MAGWLILLVGVIYVGTCVAYFFEGRPGMMLAFFGYALANLGFWWDSK